MCVITPNFVTVDQMIAEIWRFAAVRHLGFVVLGPLTRSTWWSVYRSAKLDWNRCSGFDDAIFNIFLVCLENAFTPPLAVFLKLLIS